MSCAIVTDFPAFVADIDTAIRKLGVTGHVLHWRGIHWRGADGFTTLGVAIELPDANKPQEDCYRDGRMINLEELRHAQFDLASEIARQFADTIVATGGVDPRFP